MRVNVLVAASVLAFVVACSPPSGAGAAGPAAASAGAKLDTNRHPVSGLAVIPLTVTARGKQLGFRVEVADSASEQAKGLMFRASLGPDEGMLFPMNPARPASFWMRNTVIPLDIIFIGRDRRILNIAANAVPYDETPLTSAGSVSGVLEIPGGRAEALGIAAGDRVAW
jgi:uncharacterized membrane protein (UPF0127 family)